MNKKYFYSKLDGIVQIEGITFALSDFSHVMKTNDRCSLCFKSNSSDILMRCTYQEFIDILFSYFEETKELEK